LTNYPNAKAVKYFGSTAQLFAALTAGTVDVVFSAQSDLTGSDGYDASTMPAVGPTVSKWNEGVSFMCNPGRADIVALLNQGLEAVMGNGKYKALCELSEYAGSIQCLSAHSAFTGNKLTEKADIIIGMEADYGSYNNINAASQLVGFDVELTNLVCAAAGIKCAIMTTPWQSVIAKDYASMGWETNPKTYPGIGFQEGWFHCSSGSRNLISRQQSLSFSDPYTDATTDPAVFVGKTGQTMAEDASDVTVGLQSGYATNAVLLTNFPNAKGVTYFGSAAEMFSALEAGTVDVVFSSQSDLTGSDGYDASTMPKVGPTLSKWNEGVSFMCHPSLGDIITKLNTGLKAVMTDGSYTALCNKAAYSDIQCLSAHTSFTGNKLTERADIIIGMEADYGSYNNINEATQLVGFDVELTKLVCAQAGIKCAIMTAPWQSVIAKNYVDLGWDANPKTYPGKGILSNWFHCSSGSRNLIARQQSLSFSDPYTDATTDPAVFVSYALKTMADDASDVTVGLQSGYATTPVFLTNYAKAKGVTYFSSAAEMFAALKAGTVDVLFFAQSDLAGSDGYDTSTMFQVGPTLSKWNEGVSFMCHPSLGDVVTKLNTGLKAVMTDGSYTTLCSKAAYTDIQCLGAHTSFTGNKLTERADLVVGMEADYGSYNNINEASQLVGLDVELTNLACAAVNLKCAIVTAPWQSMMAKNFASLGWDANPKAYPGIGLLGNWFHCSSGSRNLITRQQSLSFSDPYTDATTDPAAFVGMTGMTMNDDASDVLVGLQAGYASSSLPEHVPKCN